MAKKIYALLVGINDYAPEVGKLAGCLNDVDHFKDYLTSNFNNSDLAIEVLKDSDSTRDNIIKMFRTHLGKAKADDVALFQYCGHGARWAAAKEFKEFYPDGKDEGLVCYDSRRDNGTYPFDLADKELAALLAEVAANEPHLAVILDCCHSGSATRDADSFKHLKPRQTHEVKNERPLDSYLDGYYAKLQKKGASLSIPRSRHILLAACDRKQKAYEAPDRSGLFTSTMLKALEKSGSDITYADLFIRCRAEIRKYADNQTPQFETNENFNAFNGFLGRQASHTAPRYSVYFDSKENNWRIDAGALHGLPTEPEKSVGVALYPEDDQAHLAGRASTIQVGPQKSDLKLEFESDPKARYYAEITSLPVAPLPIYFEGDANGIEMLRKALNPSIGVELTDIAEGTRYGITAHEGEFMLKQRELDLDIQGAKGVLMQTRGMAQYTAESARLMLEFVKQIVKWERGLALQNHGTKMDNSLVDFVYVENLGDNKEHEYTAGEITLDFIKSKHEDTGTGIKGKIKARNRTLEELHILLIHFSSAYGIEILSNNPVPPGETYVTLWGDSPKHFFALPESASEDVDNFKLIVSTEKVDDFLLEQDELEIGKVWSAARATGSSKRIKMLEPQNDWFTKNLRIKVVRQIDQVGAKEAKLKDGKIVIKSHPSVKANLSLSAAKTPSRSAGEGTDFYKAFERQGLEMLNFAGTRGDSESILELTDIENAEALAKQPLEIDVNVPLNEDEYILPVVFDGQYAVLGGEPSKENGNVRISIDHIPEVPDNRRSVGKALKLYFFKTYLKREDVNLLRWVEFKPDGSFERQKSMVANKVAAAQNILLLIHGIIGDTEVMAKGLRMAGLEGKFDLVLTYDYENLSTPIEETAEKLKKQLAEVGLGDNDNKKLTLLVHSMGGLVARCFIEQKDGNQVVDHLVMCGTPNNGSPFGEIEKARKLINILTPLAMTYVPVVVPFASALLFRLKKITPALEEMNPSSEFIKGLNGSRDPGVRYTILAGDINAYKDPAERSFLQKLLEKVARGFVFDLLFGGQTHDIAVSVNSILDVAASRNPVPKRANVACHHLNYFISEPGQKALLGVEW